MATFHPQKKAQSSPLNFKRWHACDMTHTWENSKKLGFLKSGSTGAAKKTPARCFFLFPRYHDLLAPASSFHSKITTTTAITFLPKPWNQSIEQFLHWSPSLPSLSPFPLLSSFNNERAGHAFLVPKVSLWFKVLLYFYFCFFILITRSSVRDFFMVLLWGLLFCFSLVDCTFFLVSCIFFCSIWVCNFGRKSMLFHFYCFNWVNEIKKVVVVFFCWVILLFDQAFAVRRRLSI